MIVKFQLILQLCLLLSPAVVQSGDWFVRRRTGKVATEHGQAKKTTEPTSSATSDFVVVPGPQIRSVPPVRPPRQSNNLTSKSKDDKMPLALNDVSSATQCKWVAWMQTCTSTGPQGYTDYPSELVVATSYDDWIDVLYEKGDQGKHLMKVAVDEDNDLYFGYFQEISASYGWISTGNWDEFQEFYEEGFQYDYDITAMYFANGKYFLWLRYQPNKGSSYFGTYSLDAFKDHMTEMGNQGFVLTAMLLDDEDSYGDYWFGWYQRIVGIRYWHPWTWSQRPSLEALTDDFNEKLEGSEYLGGSYFPTALVQNTDNSWLAWYEFDWFYANTWATRGDPDDMNDWINEQQYQYGRCLAALAHGCE